MNTTDKTLSRLDSQIPALRNRFAERLRAAEHPLSRTPDSVLLGDKLPQWKTFLDAFAASCQDVLGAPANQTETERYALRRAFFLDKTLQKRNGQCVELGELRAFMEGYVKGLNLSQRERERGLEPLDLAIEVQGLFDLVECQEPDCSVHPELIKIAKEVLA